MRDMDIFNQTSILKMLVWPIKWPIKPISAQLPFPRAFAYFTKVN